MYLGDRPIAVLNQTVATGAATVQIDESTTANVTAVGSWTVETPLAAGAVNNNYLIHAGTTTTTDSFTWKIALPAVGKYYFQVRWPAIATRATNAPYTVTATDGVSTKVIDQHSINNTWVNLAMKTNGTVGNVATVKLATSNVGSVAADMARAVPIVVTTTVNYLFADHLNTPRVITRASDNQMVWLWDTADPFGVNPPNTNPAGLGVFTYNPRFPGQVYDSETGLYYNVNRSYDPNIGGYTQSDPIGLAGGVNTYAYAGGNPVNAVDPLGLFGLTAEGGFSCLSCHNEWINPPVYNSAPYSPRNKINSKREDWLLSQPVPGFPEDPDNYCPRLKQWIDELNETIKWRQNDLDTNVHDPDRVSHTERIKNLKEKRDKFQKNTMIFAKIAKISFL